MKKLPVICFVSALAFQSSVAFAEPTQKEKVATIATIGGTFGTVQAIGAWGESKANGPVPNEKPLAAYGKEVYVGSIRGGISHTRMQVVAAPVKAEDMPGVEFASTAKKAIKLDKKTGDLFLIHQDGFMSKIAPKNQGAGIAKIVAAAFYDNDRYVVTLDEKSVIRKFAVGDRVEMNMYGYKEPKAIRELLIARKNHHLEGKIWDFEAPVFLEDVEDVEYGLKKKGHKDVRTYEVGKTASVKKAIADFSKRIGGAKGYAKIGAAAVIPSAVTAGFLYAGDKKMESLGEVENAPRMRKLEEVEAAQGEK